MIRPPGIERLNARSALRQRRIAAFSTPAASSGDDAPRLRWTIDQSCRAKGVTLTEARRRLAQVFDETDTPLSVGEVWERAQARQIKAGRSLVYQLVRALVAKGVLIVAENGQSIRYAAPLAVRLGVRGADGEGVTAINDPLAVEALTAALLRSGRLIDDRDLIIDLVARDDPQS